MVSALALHQHRQLHSDRNLRRQALEGMDLVLRLLQRLLEAVASDLLLLVVALVSPPLLLLEGLGLLPLPPLVLPLLFRTEIPSQQFHNPLVRHRLSQLRQLILGFLRM